MSDKIKTQMVLPVGPNADRAKKLESRAARFGIIPTTDGSSNSSTISNPADALKLANRAARFMTSNSNNLPSSTPMNVVATSPEEAERLAKRAARFADIPQSASKTTATTTQSSGGDSELLAKRAARFAGLGTK